MTTIELLDRYVAQRDWLTNTIDKLITEHDSSHDIKEQNELLTLIIQAVSSRNGLASQVRSESKSL